MSTFVDECVKLDSIAYRRSGCLNVSGIY